MELVVNSESIAKDKIAIRKAILQKRRELSHLKRDKKSDSIAERLFKMGEFKESKSVFCFLSTSFEVQTDGIIRESLRLGKQVLVPLLGSGRENSEVVRISSMDIEFLAGRYGIREPAPKHRSRVPFSTINLVITPGLAFDAFGNRIGFGGGYYDKFFKKMNEDVIRVAVGYDFQILNLVPYSDLDETVHFVVTETKTLRCREVLRR